MLLSVRFPTRSFPVILVQPELLTKISIGGANTDESITGSKFLIVIGTPGQTRTGDTGIRNPLLYPLLSYGGVLFLLTFFEACVNMPVIGVRAFPFPSFHFFIIFRPPVKTKGYPINPNIRSRYYSPLSSRPSCHTLFM